MGCRDDEDEVAVEFDVMLVAEAVVEEEREDPWRSNWDELEVDVRLDVPVPLPVKIPVLNPKMVVEPRVVVRVVDRLEMVETMAEVVMAEDVVVVGTVLVEV